MRSVALLAARSLDDVVEAFWHHYERKGEPLRSSVAHLSDLALSADSAVAGDGTRVLFDRVVEPLCDGFTEQGARTYERAFAQIIFEACRRQQCRMLNATLAADGISSEQVLLRHAARAEPKRCTRPTDEQRARIKRVVVLSRLTLGADVAITSVVLRRMEELFPFARICCVGTEGASVLARSFSRVEHSKVRYRRSDYLAERLNAWPSLRAAVRAACEDAAGDESIVVDPDSRLTQLGLLPPVNGDRYFHFPGRSYAAADASPLSALVGRWLDETFGEGSGSRPALRLPPEDAAWSRALRTALDGSKPIVCISFGVGGNERKRKGTAFEIQLIEWITRRGCRVLLARGSGRAEVEQSYRLGRDLEQRGVPVCHLPPGRGLAGVAGDSSPVVTWEADVAAFVAAVACADLYVGYDSAGQHIAAALGVPTLTLFIESAGRRHAERWTPRGQAPVRVIRCATPADAHALFDEARSAFDSLWTRHIASASGDTTFARITCGSAP